MAMLVMQLFGDRAAAERRAEALRATGDERVIAMGRSGAGGGVSGIEPDERPGPDPAAPWSADGGPEPAWADAIRRGRKARGDRLRAVFDTFGDDDPPTTLRRAPASDEDEGS